MKKNSSNLREQALDELKIFEINSDQLITFYEYGTFENPGLSDLDLIVEISPEYSNIFKFSKDSLPNKVKEVMAHASLIAIKEKEIFGLNLWDDIKLLRIRDQKIIQDKHITKSHLRNIAMFIDFYYERRNRLMMIIKKWKHMKMNTRHILGYCKSYLYSLKVFKRIKNIKILDFKIDEIEKIIQNNRNIWIDLNIKEQESICFSSLMKIQEFENFYGEEIDNHINCALLSLGLSENENIPKSINIPNGPVFNYEKNNENYITKVPKLVMEHFSIYANEKCGLSLKIKRCLSNSNYSQTHKYNTDYSDFLKERINEANKWHLFKNKFNHKCGLYKFGWFK